MVKKRKRNPNAPIKTENEVQQPEPKKVKKESGQFLIDPQTGESIPLTKSGQPDMRCSISRRYMERMNLSNNSNNNNSDSSINDWSQNATFNDSSLLNNTSTVQSHTLNRVSSNDRENNISLNNNSTLTDSLPSSSILLSSSSLSTVVPSSEVCVLQSNQPHVPIILSSLIEKLKLNEQQQRHLRSQEQNIVLNTSSTQTDLVETVPSPVPFSSSSSSLSVQTDPIPSETKAAQTCNPDSVPSIEATTQTDDSKANLRHVETQYPCTFRRVTTSTTSTQTPHSPITETTGTQTLIISSSNESTTSDSEAEEEDEEEDKNLDFCRVA